MSDELLAKLDNIELGASFAGVALLRDLVLPDLLNKNTGTILYWAGKELARRLPLADTSAVQDFFVLVSLGNLALIRQKGNQYTYELSGSAVNERLKLTETPDFQFETGFIAQQVEQQLGIIAEGIHEFIPKQKKAVITVQTDPKDPVTDVDVPGN